MVVIQCCMPPVSVYFIQYLRMNILVLVFLSARLDVRSPLKTLCVCNYPHHHPSLLCFYQAPDMLLHIIIDQGNDQQQKSLSFFHYLATAINAIQIVFVIPL